MIALLLLITFSSCSVAGGIFKAGFWVGIVAVAFIAGLIVFLQIYGKRIRQRQGRMVFGE